jgi:hypothetical protein
MLVVARMLLPVIVSAWHSVSSATLIRARPAVICCGMITLAAG